MLKFDVKPCVEYYVSCISYGQNNVPYSVEDSTKFGTCDTIVDESYGIGVGQIIGISMVIGCAIIFTLLLYRKCAMNNPIGLTYLINII